MGMSVAANSTIGTRRMAISGKTTMARARYVCVKARAASMRSRMGGCE